jgi:hypothetical protein
MSASKLTLSVDKDTIRLAKERASENNLSVSKLFTALINGLPTKKKESDPILEKYKNVEIPQWIKDLSVDVKIDPNLNYDEVKYEYLKEKYGL